MGISIALGSRKYSAIVSARNRIVIAANRCRAGKVRAMRKLASQHDNTNNNPSARLSRSAGDPRVSSGSFHQYCIARAVVIDSISNTAIPAEKRPTKAFRKVITILTPVHFISIWSPIAPVLGDAHSITFQDGTFSSESGYDIYCFEFGQKGVLKVTFCSFSKTFAKTIGGKVGT